MAKISAYKIVNPGAFSGVSPQVASVRKSTYAINRLGQTIAGVGSVVKDLESIEAARLSNNKLREQAERRRLQREADEAAETQAEIGNLSKKGFKSNIKPTGKNKSLLKNLLPGWLNLLLPVLEFFAKLIAFPVIREMLKWWGDPANKEKIETFFYKANVIFTKLKEFSNFVWNENILQGWSQFKNGETLKERIGGLGKLMMGIGIISMITNPLGTLGAALTGLGWLVKNLTDWLKNPFGGIKKPKVKTPKGPKTPKNKNGTPKTKLKNKYQKWLQNAKNKKVDVKAIRTKNNKFKIGKNKVTVKGNTPYIPPKGSATLKPKGWKGVLSKAKNWASKAKMPGWLGKAGRFFGPTTTTVLSGLELHDRLVNKEQTAEKAITGTAAGTVGGLAGFSVGAKGAAATLSPLLLAPFPGARPLYGVGVLAGGLLGSTLGATTASTVSDKAFDAAEDNKKSTKWYNPFSWGDKKEEKKEEKKKEEITKKTGFSWSSLWGSKKEEKKDEKKKSGFSWSSLFGNKKQQKTVTPKNTITSKDAKTKKKPWWKLWAKGGQHKLPEFFFGKIFKGVSKAVSGVFNGVKNAVGGVINTVGKVVSNPIVSTALSFVPGVGPIIGAINAVNSLRQGDILGAAMGAWGSLGNFAAIGQTAKSVVNTPNWMMNLRMSKFGQGLAGMHSGLSGAFSGIASGFNNFMSSDIGQLGKGIFTGVQGGGWGDALGAFGNMTGMTKPGGLFGEGGFFGPGGKMAGMGSWLEKNHLSGIGNMIPGLGNFLGGIPGVSQLPGISELFAGGFSPMAALGGMADNMGAGGLFRSVMGMYNGSTDYATGIRDIAGELGIGAEVFGMIDKGRSLIDRSKQFALDQPELEILPLVVPVIKGEVALAPAIKKKLFVMN